MCVKRWNSTYMTLKSVSREEKLELEASSTQCTTICTNQVTHRFSGLIWFWSIVFSEDSQVIVLYLQWPTSAAAHTRGRGEWHDQFTLQAIKLVCILDFQTLLHALPQDLNAISEGSIQPLTSCGGAYLSISHVTAVKLGRGGIASLAPTQRWSVTTLKPLWLKGKISATLTAAYQRQTALRWHWHIPSPLHLPGHSGVPPTSVPH